MHARYRGYRTDSLEKGELLMEPDPAAVQPAPTALRELNNTWNIASDIVIQIQEDCRLHFSVFIKCEDFYRFRCRNWFGIASCLTSLVPEDRYLTDRVPEDICLINDVPEDSCLTHLVPKSCCLNDLVPKGCCLNDFVAKGCCLNDLVAKGCCLTNIVPKGCCLTDLVPKGSCLTKHVQELTLSQKAVA